MSIPVPTGEETTTGKEERSADPPGLLPPTIKPIVYYLQFFTCLQITHRKISFSLAIQLTFKCVLPMVLLIHNLYQLVPWLFTKGSFFTSQKIGMLSGTSLTVYVILPLILQFYWIYQGMRTIP